MNTRPRSGALAAAMLLVVLLLSGGAGSQSANAAPFRLRALSYNCGSGAHIPLDATGMRRIAEEIIECRADIVGITELDIGTTWYDGRDQVSELRVALAERGYAMYGYSSVICNYMGGWLVHGLLSRWPIVDSETRSIWPERNWSIDRITVEPLAGLHIDAYMTHIWPGEDAQSHVADCFSFVNESGNPRFIMGDFNTGYGSEYFNLALKAGFRQTCAEANGAPCLTVGQGATISGPLPQDGQIDHIFISKEVEVIRSWTHYTSISDHWPIAADLAIPSPPGAPDLGDNVRRPKPRPHDPAIERYLKGDYAGAAALFRQCHSNNPQDADAPYFLYSAGCMSLLSGDKARAKEALAETIAKYPNNPWGVRAMQRLGLLMEDQGLFKEAAEQYERFIAAYYDILHPDPRSRSLEAAIRRLILYSTRLGDNKTTADFVRHFAESYPGRRVSGAAYYMLSLAPLEEGDHAKWWELFDKSMVDLDTVPPVDNVIRKMAYALVALGRSEEADELHDRFVGYIEPNARRGRLGRYWKVRYPADYAIQLEAGKPWTLALEGERHVAADPLMDDPPKGSLTLVIKGDVLSVEVDVADATHVNNATGEEIWKGDCLQLAIDPGAEGGGIYDTNDSEWGIALAGGKISRYAWKTGEWANLSRVKAEVRRVREVRTVYNILIPLDAIGVPAESTNVRMGLNLIVNDNDGRGLAARLEWTPGMSDEKAPGLFPIVEFGR